MPEYYGASFTIERSYANEKAIGIEMMSEISEIARQWARERINEPIGSEERGEWKDSNDTHLRIDSNTLNNVGFFDLTLDHPDSRLRSSRWRTDFRFSTLGSSVDVDIEVRLVHEVPPQSEDAGNASRPRILESIFEQFECRFGQEKLTRRATEVTPSNATQFVNDTLFDTNRRMPVVAVTKNSYGGRFVNPDRLQSRLLGLARVFTYDDETAQVANETLNGLKCFGGAVRIYRPGCSVDDVSMAESLLERDVYLGNRMGPATSRGNGRVLILFT